ncbi:PRC-barrel domain-containing protein [Rhodopirellula sp. JC740]|uniref:PRC-barrel domain-containing protein n=1 Tax=Rhodopirellula halodulae TaxID=2894198 RepID=A0ABS8NNV0_9BACT|nr:PRC-barrel domain-containing protein [Rhodopirellula sp. JC740]MCC9645243.1 PRC-barrel domain-containing protein [Rhodopirellula sp. JC740]
MLVASDKLKGAELMGIDQSVGSIHDLLFDDESWVIRHLVVDTGHWLPGRQILLPPPKIDASDWPAGTAKVPLTSQQVKDSPPVESDQPVSRQMEIQLYQHYDVPYYWGPAGATLAGSGYSPMPLGVGLMPVDPNIADQPERTHLRSVNEVVGYYIQGTDEEVGHVEGMLIDDTNWSIQQLIVDTRNWWPGKQVLLDREHVAGISWADATVSVSLSRDSIRSASEYDPTST